MAKATALIRVVLITLALQAPAAFAQFDLVLRNGTIVDGTGAQPFVGDVAIAAGKVVAIGEVAGPARATLDVEGLVVAPGFIDVHSHADAALADPAFASVEGFLRQGVTTAVFGVDGFMGVDQLAGHIALADAGGVGINFMSYVGHNSVRREILGDTVGPPDAEALARMQALVEKGMRLGAIGLSTGLMYLPGNHARTDEIVALAKATAPFGGRYDSHVRDPANNLLASHRECLDIARAAGVPAHPAHIKAVGGKNFGKGPDIVRLIAERRAAGENITVDLYPYDGASTRPVLALLHPGDDSGGRELRQRLIDIETGAASESGIPQLIAELADYWKGVEPGSAPHSEARTNTEQPPAGVYSWIATVGYESMRVVVSKRDDYVGRMVTEIAAELEVDPFELFRRIIVEEGAAAMVTLGAIMEDDVRVIMREPWAMIASDGEEVRPSHPRGRGTFPRVLGRYVREWGVLSLEEAVHKVTGLPANYLGLLDRGTLRTGAVADIAAFDPERIVDLATWDAPARYSEGVHHVLIGGQFALKDGQLQARRFGRFIPLPAQAE